MRVSTVPLAGRVGTALVCAAALAGCSGMRASAGAEARATTERTPGPLTRAEASGFTETSTHADVLAFIEALPPDPRRHVTTFGTTPEGRALPLVVWNAGGASAEAVRASGTTRVLLVANIHGGEVDGKEAMLILLRDLASGRHVAWADSLTILVAPIYNADGNDRIAPDNRPLQLGPTAGMGERANAAGLDLNRDFTRLAAPETRALVAVMRDYDPHVVVDLHTTDGTPMAYGLTYAPGLHPDTPAAISADLYDRWLPQITQRLAASGGPLTFHYGNVPGAFGEEAVAPRGWYSYSAGPRYSTNYAGLRGRYGVLSESYSYDPFEARIRSSRRFAEEILEQTYREARHVRASVWSADHESVVGREVAVRTTFAIDARPHEILLGRVDTLLSPTGQPMRRNTGQVVPETMPVANRFVASETTVAPQAYIVRVSQDDPVLRLLDAHGIQYSIQGGLAGTDARLETFLADSVAVSARAVQGVHTQEAFGRWVPFTREGSPLVQLYLHVPVDQPLGRLVVVLLDPRSDDGVVAWGLVSAEALRSQSSSSIYLPAIGRIP